MPLDTMLTPPDPAVPDELARQLPSARYAGKRHRIEAQVLLPRPIAEVFAFFADAFNLDRLTPSYLRFHILTPPPIVMRPGAIIDYRLRIHGLPIRWRTCITVWDPPHRFVDEQVRGPYRLWHHEHLFKQTTEGTLCTDRVHYASPGGSLIHRCFVRPDVQRIFQYRSEKLREIFAP